MLSVPSSQNLTDFTTVSVCSVNKEGSQWCGYSRIILWSQLSSCMMRLAKGHFMWLKAILVEATHQLWLAQSHSDVKDHYWLFMWNRSAPVCWQRCSKWADCLTALGSPVVLDAWHGSLDKAGTRAGPNALHGYTACTESIRAPHKNCTLMLAQNGWNLSRPYDHLET